MFSPKNYPIHFIGIGGIGMSAIAEILIKQGYPISGSDIRSTPLTQRLSQAGATIFYKHSPDNVTHARAVVYSSAIHSDNCEIEAARNMHISVVHRSEMLSEIIRKKFSIAVTGSHGKTTTTGIIGEILHRANKHPTIVLGGILNSLSSNACSGTGDYIVVEADESDSSLLNLYPSIAIITNIDQEHMDHYGAIEKIHDAFFQFATRPPFYGASILCVDDPVVSSFENKIQGQCLTYGIDHSAQFMAQNIDEIGPFQTSFDLVVNNKTIDRFSLRMSGHHNILNALAAIATCSMLDIPWNIQKQALSLIEGVQRRMEIRGKRGQILVMDDYGHHPTEIMATLKAIKTGWPDYRLCVLFQPHRYTRTKDLFDSFSQAFHQADQLILLPIYSAGESPISDVSSKKLCQAIEKYLSHKVSYAKTFDQAIDLINTNQQQLVLTLGAGDIRQAGDLFLSKNLQNIDKF
jgi:UDP-N-acetylmuramate--alanine ligase